MPMPPDILAFFQRYRDAFNALDGEAIARLYAVPSGIAQDRVLTHWASFEPIRDNMVALCALYHERGYAGATFEPGAFVPQGGDFAIADMLWTIRWTGDSAPWRFHTSYNLVRHDEGWRVLLCTAYAEAELHRSATSPTNTSPTSD
jgi:ketosteroid isomerase-like protein